MLALLAIFIVLLVFLGWVRGLPVSITVPKASGVVAKGVAEGLAGTAIPKFVLTYGMYPQSKASFSMRFQRFGVAKVDRVLLMWNL